MFMNDGEGAS